MAPALKLDLSSSALAERSKKWVTFPQIDLSLLDNTVALVYLSQLKELHSMLASAGDRTAEQFVAAEEMDALTSDFWLAAVRAKREQEEERKEAWVDKGTDKRSEAAQKWRAFRRIGRKWWCTYSGDVSLDDEAEM